MTDTVTAAPVDTGKAQETGQTPVVTQTTAAQALTTPEQQSAWYGEIKDPDLDAWAKNKNFSDFETQLKSHRELEKMVGKDRLSFPDPEKLTEWDGWDKLGAPKEADGYKDKVKIPDLPEGMAIDDAFLNAAFAKGAAARIPAAQMQEMVNLYAEQQAQAFTAAQQVAQKSIAERDAVYEKWGPQKEANLEAAQQAAKMLGFTPQQLERVEDILATSGLLENFANIGKRMREGGLIGGGSGFMSKEQATAEITKMKTNPETQAILLDQSHPQHAAEKERFARLSAARAGE